MNLLTLLQRAPVLPVLVIERLDQAVPLARALVAGGLPLLEITLRTPAALDCLRAIAEQVPDAIPGVGTLTRPQQFAEARRAGARFAVSPGLSDALVDAGRDVDLPFLPGVFTPGEALRARDQGFELLKLFPARQAGGVEMLKALAGPLPELRFCPTGGIGAGDLRAYLDLPNVVCVGGSWVAPADAVAAGDWARISRLAAEAVARAGGRG